MTFSKIVGTNPFCGSNNCPASLGFDSEIDCCTSTQLVSPNYPNSYPNNAEQTWLLSAPTGSIITLQFQSFHVILIVESKCRTRYIRCLRNYGNSDFNLVLQSINQWPNPLWASKVTQKMDLKHGYLARIWYILVLAVLDQASGWKLMQPC